MGRRHRPLTCEEVKRILRRLGFVPRPHRGTSHEQWVRDEGGSRRKVTIDCPTQPFGQELISSMARQAGVTKRDFYAALD